MVRGLMPVVQVYYQTGVDHITAALGFDPALPHVVAPNIARAVKESVLTLCEETNATTRLEIEEAYARLKEEVAASTTEGETYNLLTERVSEIYDTAENHRAYRIAQTEGQRAVAAGQLITAKESGVELVKVWSSRGDACPICTQLDGQRRRLDEPFVVLPGGGPYSVIMHNPAHPHCLCDVIMEPV